MTSASMITCAGCTHSYADTALFCPNCGTPKARGVAASTNDPLIGKLLGERFQVLELLGQGGSGTIYRAEHVTLRRKVAVKVLHNELSRDDLAVERFRREATTVAEIDNEHIVEIHDFGRTHDSRLYLAMELLEGETLDGVLARERTLSVERTADILIQVGEALMEAHAIGYVHRDLRPRNIYLAVRRGKANFVKLLDFGLAKLVESDAQAASTSLGMTFGDPRYMSPEQARGDRIDRRADIYQLGCVAYEMLTGSPPFTGNRVFDLLAKQVSEIPAPLPTRRPGVPLWIEAAVAKMLAKDPENRFATTTRLVEALRLGLETGQIMEDEIARRRESIPPPSVSRVMQKMGLSAPIDPAGRAESALPDSGPAPTQLAGAQGLASATPAEERRRTGTPQLGVPVQAALTQPPVAGQIDASHAPAASPSMPSAPVYVAPPSGPNVLPGSQTAHGYAGTPVQMPGGGVGSQTVTGYTTLDGPPAMPPPLAASPPPAASPAAVAPAEHAPVVPTPATSSSSTSSSSASAAGRSKRSSQLGPSDSAAWFEDGERASEEADQVRARKVVSPSTTDLSLYDDIPAQRRRWPLVAAILGGLAVVGGIAFALSGDDDKPAAKQDTVAAATTPSPAPPTDVPPSQIITGDGSAAPSPAAPAQPTVATPPANTAQPPTRAKDSSAAASATGGSRRPTGGSRTGGSTHSDNAGSRRPGAASEWFSSGGSTNTDSTGTTTGGTNTASSDGGATSATTNPTNGSTGVSGSDGPVDPYGGNDQPPADTAAPDKKAEFFANLGKQQLLSGDAAGAAASFKKALELDAKNVAAVLGMGEIALRQGLFGDAIAHLRKAAKLAPRSSHVFTLLGEAYLGTGNNAVAADNFKKALQLDPENVRAREGFNDAQSRVPPAEDD